MESEGFKKLVEALPPESNPQTMDTLYDRLMAKGRQEGIEIGLEQGLEQGRVQGSELAKKEAVLSGFRLGISAQTISLMTGFSEEKVLQIFQEDQGAEG
jgi:predicted transposase/invertase (TIGR01784 family)